MEYLYVKALHIIFVVTWFSGMFYLVRLFIYNTEANIKPEPERSILQGQFTIMAGRLLYIITWPSAILTLLIGLYMLHLNSALLYVGWMHVKLTLLVLLFIYHHTLHFMFKQQRRGVFRYTTMQLRIWNEVSTIFLVAIVFLAVVKSNLSMVYGIVGLLLFAMLLMLAIRLYKMVRKDD
jgi:protoporphyrinogen IX oxidase